MNDEDKQAVSVYFADKERDLKKIAHLADEYIEKEN